MARPTSRTRVGGPVRSSELTGVGLVAIAPLVLVIVTLGVYPNFVLHRSEAATVSKIRGAQAVARGRDPRPVAVAEKDRATLPAGSGP